MEDYYFIAFIIWLHWRSCCWFRFSRSVQSRVKKPCFNDLVEWRCIICGKWMMVQLQERNTIEVGPTKCPLILLENCISDLVCMLLPLMINSAYLKYIFLHILESRCELQLLSLCKCSLYSYHKDSTDFLHQTQGVL